MLPPAHRMHRSDDFSSAVRSGSRARSGSLVVHQAVVDAATDRPPALAGLVVNRAVGGSVVRHRVSRRLRALLAQRLDVLPAGSATVVRALPRAGRATFVELGRDLDASMRQLERRRTTRTEAVDA